MSGTGTIKNPEAIQYLESLGITPDKTTPLIDIPSRPRVHDKKEERPSNIVSDKDIDSLFSEEIGNPQVITEEAKRVIALPVSITTPVEITPIPEESPVPKSSSESFDLIYYIRNNSKEDLERKIQDLIRKDEQWFNSSVQWLLDWLRVALLSTSEQFNLLSDIITHLGIELKNNQKDYLISGFNHVEYKLDDVNTDTINTLSVINRENTEKSKEYIRKFDELFAWEKEWPIEIDDDIVDHVKQQLSVPVPVVDQTEIVTQASQIDNSDNHIPSSEEIAQGNDIILPSSQIIDEENIHIDSFVHEDKLSMEKIFWAVDNFVSQDRSVFEVPQQEEITITETVEDHTPQEIIVEENIVFPTISNSDEGNFLDIGKLFKEDVFLETPRTQENNSPQFEGIVTQNNILIPKEVEEESIEITIK